MFDAAEAAGGIAAVHWLVDVAPDELHAAAGELLANQHDIDCVQVFVTGGDGRYVAESFSPAGRRIHFCGHGALSAAWVVFDQHEQAATTLEFSNAEQHWQARRSASELSDISLTYSQPLVVDCAVPEFAEQVLGVQPLAAASVGDSSGYLILQLADADSVRTLQPDYTAITAASDRALIVTAQTHFADDPGCVFRYFAPQYGTPEDAATGSAAVQLAAFWSSRLQCKRFSALQLSPEGAWLQLGCDAGSVDLAARVRYR
jgi:predicted PhzF superfamily epimerase YddE/YHI9